MGWGRGFRCKKCGFTCQVFLGIGYRYPEMYEMAEHMITSGKCGKEWKDLFDSIPGAATSAEKELHVCPDPECGGFQTRMNLSIYAPKDPNTSKIHNKPYSADYPAVGMEYATPDELADDYRLVRTYVHKCPECGKPMRPYRGLEKLKCPQCEEPAMEEYPIVYTWN